MRCHTWQPLPISHTSTTGFDVVSAYSTLHTYLKTSPPAVQVVMTLSLTTILTFVSPFLHVSTKSMLVPTLMSSRPKNWWGNAFCWVSWAQYREVRLQHTVENPNILQLTFKHQSDIADVFSACNAMVHLMYVCKLVNPQRRRFRSLERHHV